MGNIFLSSCCCCLSFFVAVSVVAGVGYSSCRPCTPCGINNMFTSAFFSLLHEYIHMYTLCTHTYSLICRCEHGNVPCFFQGFILFCLVLFYCVVLFFVNCSHKNASHKLKQYFCVNSHTYPHTH